MSRLLVQLADANTKIGRKFDFFVQGLIIASIFAFCAETVPSLHAYNAFFNQFEIVATVAFTLEYLIRLFTASRKFRFVFSFYGLIDLAAILPFYISLGTVDLRVVRIFRLLRLFRALKLMRYTRAIERLKVAYSDVKEELVVFGFLSAFILFLASAGIYYFEHEVQPDKFVSIFEAFWWAVCTLTTVGYGDVYPITTGGKAFTVFILFLGLGIVAIPTALLAASLKASPKDISSEDSLKKAS